jgi:hypothetical protein
MVRKTAENKEKTDQACVRDTCHAWACTEGHERRTQVTSVRASLGVGIWQARNGERNCMTGVDVLKGNNNVFIYFICSFLFVTD